MANSIPDRLSDLLVAVSEGLDVEVKNWIDLDDPDGKATFAKAALALANHGGGVVIFGMTETSEGMVQAEGRPASMAGYGQDLVNGIIHYYADPPFHCAVHLRAGPDGAEYPIVVIPGGHRAPIRAKRGGPNGQIVKDNSIYIRRPGPRSETPQSSQDWDALLGRCLSNRRDEMFDQIRALITGAVPVPPASPEPDALDQWIERSIERWTTLIAKLPSNSASRCPHGYMWFAFALEGRRRALSPGAFNTAVRAAEVDLSGWPPFWYPTRKEIQPYPFERMVECWIGGDTAPVVGDHGAGHSDFWRVSPEGFGFLLRGYREDDIADRRGGPGKPGSELDIEWPVAHTAEVLLYIGSLSRQLMEGDVTVRLACGHTGLAGRMLASISGRRVISHRLSQQGEIRSDAAFDVAAIDANLAEIIRPLLEPLYATFNFFELPAELVANVSTLVRQGRYG
ncbi:AlbA family DNA-binding domain-containing protein [Flavisphingomonas formosensis]|uniref:AlbA family DNA-binding domain-containing protein n=1 Tax=Flavisphingomonas formosensis TaxID=861534 RepID=UPI0012FBA246|nr:hypothetical protein [Sphingomonas formosensis]